MNLWCCFTCGACKNSARKGNKVAKWVYMNRLLLITIAAVVLGVALGFIMRTANFSPVQRYYWGFAGDVLMMNMLKSIIVPLIIFSILTGVASLAEGSSKLSMYAVAYYLTTTVLAIILGIVVVLIIQPGKGVDQNTIVKSGVDKITSNENKQVADGLLDIIRNMFPPNIVEALVDQASTARNAAGTGIVVSYGGSQNVLGIITFCSVFGYYLGKLASAGNQSCKSALLIFNGLNDAIMKVVDLIMWYVPMRTFLTRFNLF